MTGIWAPPSGLRVAIEPQTYRNAVFLATRFPLGLLYFFVFFMMAAIGFSLLTVLVGIPLLALTLAVAWACASFEGDLARWLLRVEIPPMSFPRQPGLTAWRRARAHLANAVTWKSLAYVLLQMPVGVIVFVFQSTLLGAALALSVAPIVYVADVLTYRPSGGSFDGFFLTLSGPGAGLQPRGLGSALALGAVGFGLFLLTLHLINGVAAAWSVAGRPMLGLS